MVLEAGRVRLRWRQVGCPLRLLSLTYRWSFSPWPSRGFPSVHVWVQISPVSSGQPCGWIRAHPSDLMLTKLSFKRTCLQNAFKLWCWRRLLRVPWTAKRSNQSIPKEINPEYALEGLMLKLKLQYFGHLMGRADWKRSQCWERLKTGEEGGRG